MNWIMEYLTRIEKGAVIVSKRLRRVYEKLADDCLKPKGGYFFSEKHANRPIDFIEKFCKHSKGYFSVTFIDIYHFFRYNLIEVI